MSDLISREALLEEAIAIGKQPMPDVRAKEDLEQAITNFYYTFLNLITNAPAIEQAATAESDKRIAELENRIHEIALDWQVNQVHINVLREALERALEDLVPHRTKASTYKSVNEALASTPAQSAIKKE